MKIVYLEWTDATNNSSDWKNKKEVETWIKDEQFWVREVGFLIEETNKHIILCALHAPETEHYSEVFKELRKIPKTWVRNKKILKP